ncbi:MAG TPA: DUF4239 domain-containing protein [Micromonosporaceae bacterium]|jgi:hypothetical protein|nr:DUF4239 domain-containing protein [Micromonosporaceae bacterium]
MGVVLSGIVAVVVASLFAGVLVWVVQQVTPEQKPEAHIEATGFVFAVVGVLYAIVLAFIVIAVWDQMSNARVNTYREATALVDTYWYAQSLPEEDRERVEGLCKEYAELVIRDEWPRMQAHERVKMAGWDALDRLRKAVEGSAPAPVTASAAVAPAAEGLPSDAGYERAVAQIDALYEAREVRVAAAAQGISPVLWFVLVGGGILTVAFAYLFDIGGPVIQAVLAVGLTAMVTLLLFAVYQLEYPFSRGVRIDPEAFQFALARFLQIGR